MRAGRLVGLHAEVRPCPLGVVGIIGPWNFPVNLTVLPAASAFAAGNRVMIKMSEITASTAEVMQRLAPKYFDPLELEIVTGGRDVAATFSGLPFDHLFFTGSPSVGALVQQAAAVNLVPVTLELGGKNPVVVAPDADVQRSATRIAQGRMVNGGQVCVCPDYVFVPDALLDEFVDALRDTLVRMFPAITANQDYCSSVNDANFDRVVGLIDDARTKGARVESIVPDGESLPDRSTRKIPPTIVRDIDDGMLIARDEVFGPVLGVMGYSRLIDAVDYINQRPAPLVAYWFGPDGTELPKLPTRYPQWRSGAQRLRRTDDSVGRAVRWSRAQWHGRLPRQDGIRYLQPPAFNCGYRFALFDHWTRGTAIWRVDPDQRRFRDPDGPAPNPSAPQGPTAGVQRFLSSDLGAAQGDDGDVVVEVVTRIGHRRRDLGRPRYRPRGRGSRPTGRYRRRSVPRDVPPGRRST